MDSVAILDFGSQFSQLIARRVREAQVYCELFPFDAPAERVLALQPRAIILSGGPQSVYDPGAAALPDYVLASGRPVLGICYGMQLLAQALGGRVEAAGAREYGRAELRLGAGPSVLLAGLPDGSQVWASHGDRVLAAPAGFRVTAASDNCPLAVMEAPERGWFGLQFHPEVNHSAHGRQVLANFLAAAGLRPEWTPGSMLEEAVARVRAQVGPAPVVAAVSGGVDSSVAAALVHRAIGDQLTCIFVDTGLLRAGEAEAVVAAFRRTLGARLVAVEAADEYLQALRGVADPEEKRRIIGEKFIRIFEREARRALGTAAGARFLMQGTIYPDVVESRGPERQAAAKIKTHHNVGGLPPDLKFELVEPLRFLFKDEVRAVGEALGLPAEMVWRQPFPGPGLAVRCLGEVTPDRVARLRAADWIVTSELEAAGLLHGRAGQPAAAAQAFAVLLPVRSVGVMGDGRTYHEVCALRAVSTDDFMTADWARLPYEVLGRISSRIVNEVPGINRVVYDISSKPPATIEWE